MTYSGADYIDALGASVLVEKIKNYWHGRGHDHVRAWAEPVFIGGGNKLGHTVIYSVRSNLINGSPPPRAGWGKSNGRSYDEVA